MLTEIQAVIFDLDGTLVDSMWVWNEVDVEFLGTRQIPIPESYQREIEGMSFTETALYTKELFGLTESVEELKSHWNGLAMKKYTSEVTLKSGVLGFLNYCKERNIRLGIATSNSKELVNAVVNALKLDEFIEVILTSCEVEQGKPAPDVYLETAKRLCVSPQNCLVFEDIPMGILAGKNAGMKVCAVEDEYSVSQREEKRKLADYYITSYDEVLGHTYEDLTDE